jgi:hypothetical protein
MLLLHLQQLPMMLLQQQKASRRCLARGINIRSASAEEQKQV